MVGEAPRIHSKTPLLQSAFCLTLCDKWWRMEAITWIIQDKNKISFKLSGYFGQNYNDVLPEIMPVIILVSYFVFHFSQ